MKYILNIRTIIAICLMAALCPLTTSAQSKLTVSGTIGLYADFYKMNADSIIAPRRPPELYRLVCNASIAYREFSLPFVINITPQNTSVVTPTANNNTFSDFLKNPMNQIGIAPKYKWIQVLLGSQTPHYSELTFGDQMVFGAGLRLTPGKFRFELFGGTSRQPIAEDTVNHVLGAYKRTMYSGKIGFGKEEGSHIYILGGYASDDIKSLAVQPQYTRPESGLMASLDYRINLPAKIYIKGEIAGSMFNRDTRAKEINDAVVTIPPEVFTSRESTRMDGATNLTIGKDGKTFGIKAVGRYIGDGFVPLGYPFMQTDKLEVTIDPHFSLFKHKLNVTGGVGERVNNLTHTSGSTATQVIGYGNISAQITNNLNLSGNFSNFGFRNAVQNDTFRVQMVTMSYGVSPSYTLNIGKSINMLSFSYGHDQYKDYNVISGSLNDNNSNSAIFTYNLALSNLPLSTTILVSSFSNKLSTGLVSINSGGLTLGYSFKKNKINLSAGETISNAVLDSKNPATQLLTTVGIRYKVLKHVSFTLNASINSYNAGPTNPNYHFTENLLRTSLIYKL